LSEKINDFEMGIKIANNLDGTTPLLDLAPYRRFKKEKLNS